MKRDDWYSSTKFLKLRLLNNVSHDIIQKTQQLYDLLNLVLEDQPDLMCFDPFTIAERQLRVTSLEAKKLTDVLDRLANKLSPHNFDDMNYEPPKPKEESDVPHPV